MADTQLPENISWGTQLTPDQARKLLQSGKRLSEDDLTAIDVALFGGNPQDVRNVYHDKGSGGGVSYLQRRIQSKGGIDLMVDEANTQAELAKRQQAQQEALDQVMNGPSAADRALVEKIIGASGDVARRELSASLPILMQQESAGAAARGVLGSSSEAANRALVGAQATRSIADLMSQQQAQGAQFLAELPFKRAELGINANQMMFNQFMAGITPFTQYRQQMELLRQQRQQQNSFNPMNIVKGAVGLAVGGPAGLAAAYGIPTGKGGGG